MLGFRSKLRTKSIQNKVTIKGYHYFKHQSKALNMSIDTLNGKSVLITGGTGSLGKALTKIIFERWPQVKRLVIYSRDEQKQFQMAQEYPDTKYPAIRYFIGDVRDLERLKRAFTNVDYVIHAAAMKHVHIAEYNPDECVKTNIGGAENVIQAALATNISRVVALSTDKACAPINLYGATKLTSDKLFIAANNIRGARDIKFSVVRYGNVMGSNGSVIPFFMAKRKEGVIPITDTTMTRFNISLTDGVEMVLHALFEAWGGELFVPKIPSYNIMTVANAVAPSCEHRVIGIRPGEKIHEEMITSSDSFTTYDLGKYFVILPQVTNWNLNEYVSHFNAKPVPVGFNYTSGNNTEWETVEGLRELIVKNVDPEFKPL
jgi:UDP-N-acetylglucosamine 4,6-dehydratase